MLEHDPSSWRRKIIPDGRAQLTLSGHTHNMQFSLFDWSPMSVLGKEINGWYKEGNQSLFVTAGVGALIPWRFGATGEIVVLELRSER
jgi:predicted MPP superfamily phosphohydrolase